MKKVDEMVFTSLLDSFELADSNLNMMRIIKPNKSVGKHESKVIGKLVIHKDNIQKAIEEIIKNVSMEPDLKDRWEDLKGKERTRQEEEKTPIHERSDYHRFREAVFQRAANIGRPVTLEEMKYLDFKRDLPF